MTRQILIGARVFDGSEFFEDAAVVVEDGWVAALLRRCDAPPGEVTELAGGILAPGLIDLQVNGGGGVMLGEKGTLAEIETICRAHLSAGTTGLLPTLITDTPEMTARVIEAGIAAANLGVPGFIGLHLEGPHLDPRRKGAHDAGLIRPMTEDDLELLLHAAAELPRLMVTLAPEAVTTDQISSLVRAGVIVSLGHTDASLETANVAIAAGATCVTHLFNAMSPMSHRAPGVVGAALDAPDVFAGIICDGIHVAPEVLRVAFAAKRGRVKLFAVTDAMAAAGTNLPSFHLAGREVLRRDGRLTLADGTLAGADVTLPVSLRFLVEIAGLSEAAALEAITAAPAACIGLEAERGLIKPGARADFVWFSDDYELQGVWVEGKANP
ncbi:N-acetylglucosamine-6-phosphate deacetylase [Solirhodobacter olei]|uniref:N-acetylglucosamine-6-phosphate deacetylase n=1 Tax=Solirhodobacter olei TaxID=2493082 RepID=UPI000FDA8AE7|nr:N-acetylglucosamine-6-phosphate deacetylase [Solirhodobacter olei]